MEGRGYALAVGIFVVVFAAALSAAAVWLSQDRTPYVHYTVASQTGVYGLVPDALVKLRGVTVGRVETIRFDPANPRTVLVDIAVVPGAPVAASTYAQLGYQGITGLTYIQLDDDPKLDATRRLEPSQPIEMRPSLFDRLATAGPELLDRIDMVAQRAAELLNESNREAVARSLVNIENASAGVGTLARRLEPGAAAIAPLAADARATLARANETLAHVTALADDVKSRTGAVDEVGRAAAEVRAVAKDARAVVPRVELLIDELSRNSRTLNRLLADLDAQPQSVLLGKAPPEPGPGEPGFNGRAGRKP